MSVYSELVNEWGLDPVRLDIEIQEAIAADRFEPWDLPEIDLLEIWGTVNLREAFGLISGGETPTTYSKRMALMVRAITDPAPSILGLGDEPVDAEYTQALEIVRSIRNVPVEAEVVDDH